MVNPVTRRIATLVAGLFFITFLYSPISDINWNNIPETLAILKGIEANLTAIHKTTTVPLPDRHILACYALFGVFSDDPKIKQTINDGYRVVKEKLNPGHLVRQPVSLQKAAASLLATVRVEKERLDAQFLRLKEPATSPAVKWPPTIVSLQPIIMALAQHLEASKPLATPSRFPRTALVAAVTGKIPVPRLDFSKFALPAPDRSLNSIAKREPTPHPDTEERSATNAGAGSGASCPPAPKAPIRRLLRDVVERAADTTAYAVCDLYFVIHGKDGFSMEFLLIQPDDDGKKDVYYPALLRDKPATPDDFQHYPDEIEFVELTRAQLKTLLEMYLGEGISIHMLVEHSSSKHFPFFNAAQEAELNDIAREIQNSGPARRNNFTTARPYEPAPKPTSTAPSRRCTTSFTFCEGACTMRLKKRIFSK